MNQPAFSDLFSAQAATYAAARPTYPAGLLEFVASQAPARDVVWDCATGNGQAAVGLATQFARVIATDASEEQLRHAVARPNVEYRVARAEACGLPDGSIDAVTVAQALHWLDLDGFYAEVRRVVRRGGVIAAWSYGHCHAGEDVEAMLREFEFGAMGPYWNAQRRWVDDGYRTIPFPFPGVTTPVFELHMEWTVAQFCEYLRSWSSVGKYVREHGSDPVTPLRERLALHWGSNEQRRRVRWPLALRVGRVG